MAAGEKVEIVVVRRDGPDQPEREERFLVDWQPTMNVIGALIEIQRKPQTADGRKTTPVAWECNCLEEVCGSCTMVINGKVRQSCTALVDNLMRDPANPGDPPRPIRLEPMSKFPLVRDLVVDRGRMFQDFKTVKAWIPVDGTYDLGPGPRVSQETAHDRYLKARCMSCGCCLEVCPQYGPGKSFMGAATMNQVALMNAHPTGSLNAPERLDAAMGEGGIADCGNAQACVHACPKEIPLTDSIAEVFRQTAIHSVKKLLTAGIGEHKIAGGPG